MHGGCLGLPRAASLVSRACNEDGQTAPTADPRQHDRDSAPLRMRVQGQAKGPAAVALAEGKGGAVDSE